MSEASARSSNASPTEAPQRVLSAEGDGEPVVLVPTRPDGLVLLRHDEDSGDVGGVLTDYE
jgi:hypothetical protein